LVRVYSQMLLYKLNSCLLWAGLVAFPVKKYNLVNFEKIIPGKCVIWCICINYHTFNLSLITVMIAILSFSWIRGSIWWNRLTPNLLMNLFTKFPKVFPPYKPWNCAKISRMSILKSIFFIWKWLCSSVNVLVMLAVTFSGFKMYGPFPVTGTKLISFPFKLYLPKNTVQRKENVNFSIFLPQNAFFILVIL